jgi:hypothetical protein
MSVPCADVLYQVTTTNGSTGPRERLDRIPESAPMSTTPSTTATMAERPSSGVRGAEEAESATRSPAQTHMRNARTSQFGRVVASTLTMENKGLGTRWY